MGNDEHRLPIKCPECGEWFEKTVIYVDSESDATITKQREEIEGLEKQLENAKDAIRDVFDVEIRKLDDTVTKQRELIREMVGALKKIEDMNKIAPHGTTVEITAQEEIAYHMITIANKFLEGDK